MRQQSRLSSPQWRAQHGAALASALLLLVIITLLGLTSMRAGQIGLRLAFNEETRIDAAETAESLLEAMLTQDQNLSLLPGSDYLQGCFVATTLDRAQLLSEQGFDCPQSVQSSRPILLPSGTLATHAYVSVRRERVGGNDYAPVSALRKGDSGERFRLASFTLTAGHDRSAEALSAAEVARGVYVKVDTVDGLSLQ